MEVKTITKLLNLIENLAMDGGYTTHYTSSSNPDVMVLEIYKDKWLTNLYAKVFVFHDQIIAVQFEK